MVEKYQMIFLQSADSWIQVTPSILETMFERAENMNCNLDTFKNWLLEQPLKDDVKNRVVSVYKDFHE